MQEKIKLLFVFGTRPEAIKMAPLILEASKREDFDVVSCVTGQHKEMLQQVVDFFELPIHHNLNIMKPDQSLFSIAADSLLGLKPILEEEKPSLVIVQGDTSTAFTAALAAFYQQIPVVHIEAGLRSFNIYAPFPEEVNRKLISQIAAYHFPPTEAAFKYLQDEKVAGHIVVSGNTVIDALMLAVEKVRKDEAIKADFSFLDPNKKTILVTCHRRENFGEPLKQICQAILDIVNENEQVQVLLPVHLNPNVKKYIETTLGGHSRIHLVQPMDYPHLIWAMDNCSFILTDSGGIQEEAPALAKPVVVLREVTERMEGVEAGNAKLAGSEYKKIHQFATELINDKAIYQSMASAANPYGVGNSASLILDYLAANFH